jgi:hypothetical protein
VKAEAATTTEEEGEITEAVSEVELEKMVKLLEETEHLTNDFVSPFIRSNSLINSEKQLG